MVILCSLCGNRGSKGKENCRPKTEELDQNSRHGKPTTGLLPCTSLQLPSVFCLSHLCRLHIFQHKLYNLSFRTLNPHTHHCALKPHLPNLSPGSHCFSIHNTLNFFCSLQKPEHVPCNISPRQAALQPPYMAFSLLPLLVSYLVMHIYT